MDTVKDYLGQEIKVGSIVVYPTRTGSWMRMNKALVTDIVFDKRGNAKLKVLKVMKNYIFKYAKQAWEKNTSYYETKAKKLTIERIDRCTVVEDGNWTEEEKQCLFEGAVVRTPVGYS